MTATRGSFSPEQVDQWDITTVAVLLGVGADPISREFASWQVEYEDWKRAEDAAQRRAVP